MFWVYHFTIAVIMLLITAQGKENCSINIHISYIPKKHKDGVFRSQLLTTEDVKQQKHKIQTFSNWQPWHHLQREIPAARWGYPRRMLAFHTSLSLGKFQQIAGALMLWQCSRHTARTTLAPLNDFPWPQSCTSNGIKADARFKKKKWRWEHDCHFMWFHERVLSNKKPQIYFSDNITSLASEPLWLL